MCLNCNIGAQAATVATRGQFMSINTKAYKLNSTNKFLPLRSSNKSTFQLHSGNAKPLSLAKYRTQNRSLKLDISKMPKSAPKKITDDLMPAEQISKYMKQYDNTSGKTTTHNRTLASKASNATKIKHSWPVDASAEQYISSRFGMRNHPITGKWAFHSGLDIAANMGTDVLASATGIVEKTGYGSNIGQFVKLRHKDNSYSIYGHLSAIAVREGEKVRRRSKIGEIGSTGRSTGPHLDYSLHINGKAVDPEEYLPAIPRKPQRLAAANIAK